MSSTQFGIPADARCSIQGGTCQQQEKLSTTTNVASLAQFRAAALPRGCRLGAPVAAGGAPRHESPLCAPSRSRVGDATGSGLWWRCCGPPVVGRMVVLDCSGWGAGVYVLRAGCRARCPVVLQSQNAYTTLYYDVVRDASAVAGGVHVHHAVANKYILGARSFK